MSKGLALAIGYTISGVIVFGGFKLFGVKALLLIIAALVVDQVYYRVKHGCWQKTMYAED